GIVTCLGHDHRTGAITAIGAVSPPVGDTSEPVSQATLRIVKVFWGLSSTLAYKRHFPAIDWLTSYSLYKDNMGAYYDKNIGSDWSKLVADTMSLLQDEAELEEIVRLVGVDALSFKDRLKLESARSIREDYLHQIAFHEVDTYTGPKKQYGMLKAIHHWYNKASEALEKDVAFSKITAMPIIEKIGRMKYITEDEFPVRISEINAEMDDQFAELMGGDDAYAQGI
ncbi:MAG: V-type ATP synthase subunit A, partial [Oscillospiraceae bacterium]